MEVGWTCQETLSFPFGWAGRRQSGYYVVRGCPQPWDCMAVAESRDLLPLAAVVRCGGCGFLCFI